jgi:hypothetical protein
MTRMDLRLGVAVEDLGVSESEEKAGVAGLLAITYRRLTIVVAEDDDGLISAGVNVSWPTQTHEAHFGLAAARQKAIAGLVQCRARHAEHKARRVEA